MNPERFCDALHYLDDDLIAETDDLRQGRRVLRPGRQVIRWVVPAACLALVIGVAAMPQMAEKASNTGTADMVISYESENAPGEMVQDSAHNETGKANYERPCDWQRVSAGGISLEIPAGWTWRVEEGEDVFSIYIRPDEVPGELWICRDSSFGVCGTDLTEKEAFYGGKKANVGYYGGSSHWDFITFRVGEEKYVVRKDGAESWWDANEDTVDRILETLAFEQ